MQEHTSAINGDTIKNRLQYAQSPYLLQHADNPVDWYEWGDEAFAAARREDKPIFLSIGYSTCHWCHVMEHESFEDDEVAALMNNAFISIKVDREERPDIDNIYMTACQVMQQRGGWPLTIIMTPEKKPFFAGTYIPKESRYGRLGMMDLIPRITETWQENREKIYAAAEEVTNVIGRASATVPGEELTKQTLETAYQQLAGQFDRVHGGFGTGMKFPMPHNLMFLLRYADRTDGPRALEMVETTLQAMRTGGIYDHIGYGFHRYATDAVWLLPHFEKMLYDQALLIMAYTEAYLATGHEEYAQTAREVISYVLRDMTSSEGGFYSAEDADSEGVEGKFYVWKTAEIRDVLGEELADLFIDVYNLRDEGNFREEATGERTGANIPHLTKSWEDLAAQHNRPVAELRTDLETARQKLFTIREQRVHPYKDDKILTNWNGLMIAALAKAGQAFAEEKYISAARQAEKFITEELRDQNGNLLHRYRNGSAGIQGNCDDYAFFVWGLIDLYEATFDLQYLRRAVELTRQMMEHFWDADDGGFYLAAESQDDLIVRQKEIYDGAVPSGNSVAASNMIRLARLTGETRWEDHAAQLMQAFSGQVAQGPANHTVLLQAVDFVLGPSHEVVIVGSPERSDTQAMLQSLRERFLPRKVVLLKGPSDTGTKLGDFAEFTKTQEAIDGQATAYVCQNFACALPTTDPQKMVSLIEGAEK